MEFKIEDITPQVIRQQRTRMGLTQAEFGELIGRKVGIVCRMERGQMEITKTVKLAILQVLNQKCHT